MFNHALETAPECDIFGEPHLGYEKTHSNLTKAYERLHQDSLINKAAMALLNSGVYWTPELLRKNYDPKRPKVFATAIAMLERVELEG